METDFTLKRVISQRHLEDLFGGFLYQIEGGAFHGFRVRQHLLKRLVA